MTGCELDRALLPGALARGSEPHGTGDYVYAIIGEPVPFGGPVHGWRLALLSRPARPGRPPRPCVEIVDGEEALPPQLHGVGRLGEEAVMARAYPGSLAARENELREALGSGRWDIRTVIEASDEYPGQRFLMLEPGLGLRSDAFIASSAPGAWVHLP